MFRIGAAHVMRATRFQGMDAYAVARCALDEILYAREIPRQTPHDMHAALQPPEINIAEATSELYLQGVASLPVGASNASQVMLIGAGSEKVCQGTLFKPRMTESRILTVLVGSTSCGGSTMNPVRMPAPIDFEKVPR